MSDIIPFGKYKGQEIEQVRMRDPQYLQWLTQQAWFAEKFAPVYQLVVNNFAPPAEDTPAHNAIQVRFLDFDFRCAFWRLANIKTKQDWLQRCWDRNTEHLRSAPRAQSWRRDALKSPYYDSMLRWHREEVGKQWKLWRRVRRKPTIRYGVGEPQFETVSDVEYELTIAFGYHDKDFRSLNAYDSARLLIEIKPSMGDDYPAVLRQIKRQKVNTDADRHHWFLLLDEFGSSTVTLEQVRAIFAAANITIVRLADVREQLIKQQR